MKSIGDENVVSLEPDVPFFQRFYTVSQLTVIGTLGDDGTPNLAPKHMTTPLGWDDYFGFVCTPSHATYQNIKNHGAFTVTFPRPEQVVSVSLSAEKRDENDRKPDLDALEKLEPKTVDGVFLKDGYAFLECELDRIVDDFGKNSLIAGKIVEKYIDTSAVRNAESSEESFERNPLLAFMFPDRYAEITDSYSFPYPDQFERE
jgi:flavin reductase (DIM6/NTAB) family NADH-FMN oxidoreductase RutF